MAVSITAAVAAAQANAVNTAIGTNPTVKIYTGSKPATPETTATGTLLATITLTGYTASGNVLTSNDPASVTPVAGGTAGWFRVATSGGTSILDGLVGTSASDMNLSSTTLSTGVQLDLAAMTITLPVA